MLDDRGHSANGRRRGTSREVLALGESWVHHVHVRIDASGEHNETVRFHDLVTLSRPGGRAPRDSPSGDQQIA